ncbi:hypothetical protein [Hymenobacter actinosclerus]|uniref:Uncharacterized protein n=1 Tax=Hymenobacter actinosclerus TaxID=82805 RepID=A0A1I0DMH0_9BACT|nr:hypothetical protein [Hymenobacter actinosclerus]SET33711.1 hypothetical protein SAMN04487998_1472 [Hymenobacter actinosclerus]
MKYLYPFALLLFCATAGHAQDSSTSEKPKFLTDTSLFEITTVDTAVSSSTMPGFSTELDKRYGFRGLRFETPLAQVKGLKFVANRGGKAVYTKLNENKVLGNAHLKQVFYCFYRGQLSDILFSAAGSSNADEVLKVLTQAYGMPFEQELTEDEMDGHFYWHGNKATALLSIPIDEDDFDVIISSIPLKEKEQRDKELRVKRAAEKL